MSLIVDGIIWIGSKSFDKGVKNSKMLFAAFDDEKKLSTENRSYS